MVMDAPGLGAPRRPVGLQGPFRSFYGMTSWVVLCPYITLGTDTSGGSLGGESFVVKVDTNRNRKSAEENTQRSKLLQPKPFSQRQIFLEFEFTAHS